jgi:hypothetical protein
MSCLHPVGQAQSFLIRTQTFAFKHRMMTRLVPRAPDKVYYIDGTGIKNYS